MCSDTNDGTRFVVAESDVDIDTLVIGFTEYGLAGLTAVDYLS